MNFLSKFKKGLSLALLAVLSVAPAMVSAQYTDQAEIPSWATEAISELGAIGVMTGNDDGSFAPNAILNRAEVSKIIVLAADVAIDTTGGAHFPDVAEGAWYYDYVETMYNYGWIGGYPDGDFRPGNTINRAEIAKMVVNAFEIAAVDNGPSFSDVAASDWFYGYVETVKANSIMLGYNDGTFDPAGDVTRAEAAKIIYEGLLVATEVTGPAAGTLEVSLSNDTPRGTNIPYNATSVPFTTIELSAADDSDIEVSSITLTRLGLGDNDDFDSVWLEIDGFKVGNDRSVNNDDIVELRFNPPIVVPAGQTLVADVVASTKYTLANDGTCFDTGAEGCNIGHFNRFAVVSADDIVSTAANVVGGFPVEGEEMQVANYQVSQMVMSTLGSATTVNVGDSFVELGKFRMLNASTTNKDIEMRAITFKNQGTAELANVLENFALYVSGEQVSAETIIDGDYVTFRLDNGVTGGYVIEDGDSRIFSMRADVVSAEANDDITFKVDNFEDIVGIEIGTAFGVKTVDTAGNNAEDANATLQTYTIDSGDINVSRDPNSLGNQEYAPGSNDVVAMTARIVVSQPILVDGVTLKVDSYATANNTLAELNEYFDNFRLYLNDNLIDSENSISGTTAAPVLNYSSQFEITGASVMKLVLNVQDAAQTGSYVKFSLHAYDFDSPEYISSGDTVVTADLLGSALASEVQVAQSVLTITRTDGWVSKTAVAGIQEATFMKFVMNNNDSGDTNVTSITIKGMGTGAAAANYSNFVASLFVDGQKIGSSKTLDSTTGTAAFNDIAVVIPSAGQEEFTVVLDTLQAAATGVIVSTTTIDDLGVTTNVAGGSAETPVSTAVNIGDVIIDVVTDLSAIVAGDKVAIGPLNVGATDVDVLNPLTEIATVLSVVDVDADGNAEQITLTSGVTMVHQTTHAVQLLASVNYLANTTSIEVASVTGLAIGDIVVINATDECSVTGVTAPTTLTLGICDTTINGIIAGANVGLFTATPVGATVKKPAVDTLKLAVVSADVDNAENGSEVDVMENNIALGVVASYTEVPVATNDGDCDGNTTDTTQTVNYLCGATFNFAKSGTLTIKGDNISNDKILIGGTNGVEVYKIHFSASDDDVEIKDLYLNNVSGVLFDGRGTFTLKNSAGQPLYSDLSMTNDELHFDLNSNKIIVPEGGTTVTIELNVNDVDDETITGKVLELDVDFAKGNQGVLATTAATGADLDSSAITTLAGDANSDVYVAYRTKLIFAAATVQPDFTAGSQALFNFTVENDSAFPGTLAEIKFDMAFIDATVPLDATGTFYIVEQNSTFTGSNDVTEMIAMSTETGATPATATFVGLSETISGMKYYQVLVTDASGYVDTNSADESSIKAKFITETNGVSSAVTTGGVTTNSIIWSDNSDNSGTAIFMNGYGLDAPSTNGFGVVSNN